MPSKASPLAAFNPAPPVVFVSPHLDDVVHSCAYFLARNPGVTVLTVCAGARDGPASPWDRATTAAASAPEAIAIRRREDEAALRTLSAAPVWLELADGLYSRLEPADIRPKLQETLRNLSPRAVIAPLGVKHPDHIAVSDACLDIVADLRTTWFLYEEIPYAQEFPELAAGRRALVEERFPGATALDPIRGDAEEKAAAMDLYASQVHVLREVIQTFDSSMSVPEQYWALAPS